MTRCGEGGRPLTAADSAVTTIFVGAPFSSRYRAISRDVLLFIMRAHARDYPFFVYIFTVSVCP